MAHHPHLEPPFLRPPPGIFFWATRITNCLFFIMPGPALGSPDKGCLELNCGFTMALRCPRSMGALSGISPDSLRHVPIVLLSGRCRCGFDVVPMWQMGLDAIV